MAGLFPYSMQRRCVGFSIIELMTVLAIATTLLSLAVPSFAALSGQMRVTTTINNFLSAMNLARSEALSRGIRVDMIPNAATGWASGWTVFVDINGNQSVDGGDTIISRHEALSSDIAIGNAAPGSAFFDKKAGRQYIAFNAGGYPRLNNGGYLAGSIEMGNKHAKRKLVLSFLGRARICNPDVEKKCG